MKKGSLVVIEGAGDGVGKTTQFNLLTKKCRELGLSIASHHFPSYGTYQGAPVEEYLKGNYGAPSELSPYFINSLYALDRSVTWREKLAERFDAGDLILLDRYTTSSLIYQSALIDDEKKKNEFIDYVCEYEYVKLGIKKPDAVIFLHAFPEALADLRRSRKSNDGVSNDVHESNSDFMKKVYESALYVARRLGWQKIECMSPDGNMRTPEDLHKEICEKLSFILY